MKPERERRRYGRVRGREVVARRRGKEVLREGGPTALMAATVGAR
jgi:hypothetical protein